MFYCRKVDETDEEGEIKNEELHPLATVTNINPEDIPDIPVNKFLLRGGPNKEIKGNFLLYSLFVCVV